MQKAIPSIEVGAAAGVQYSGDGLKVSPTDQGARMHCAFQRLDGAVARDGLWLTSTVPEQRNARFRVKAVGVGRKARIKGGASSIAGSVFEHSVQTRELPVTGDVSVEDQRARFVRPGLLEEYSVSIDGVQQDFLVLEKPHGVPRYPLANNLAPATETELRVELAVTGARVEQTTYGAQLVLEQSGRRIAYSRLKVTDANGKELPARMELKSEIGNQKSEMGLVVVVNDKHAIYPVRIDPTFSDANWVSLGGIRGANRPVDAAAVDSMGNVYIGGSFTEVGDSVANGIAKWNGSAWTALGSGMGGSYPGVYALAVSGSDVYAAGAFTTAGGIAATNIAKWNGSSWSALGSGIIGDNNNPSNPTMVYALAVSGSDVYAGGYFTNAGGSSANNIAKWDGRSWSALGSGMGGDSASYYPPVVRALAVSGSDVYAGGDFTTAGGIATGSIAKWDGSTWSPLGSGLGGAMPFSSGGVYALAASGSNVYAGGYFTLAGGSLAATIARWDGSAWSALGWGTNGFSFPPSGVTALAISGNHVYAGWTTNVLCAAGGCGGGGGAIAEWDGSTWNVLAFEPIWEPGNVPTPAIYALAVSGSNLFVGGDFTTVGGTAANYIAKWDGNTWSALGSGMNGSVSALAVSGSDLYAGGGFTTAGSIAANYIAKWDGSAWRAMGLGMNYVVSAVAVSGSNVYAGGQFTTAGGSPATNIAKWDGSSWSALGSGLNGSVSAVAVSGSDLYAGGGFTIAGGIPATNIAKWNGSTWSAVGLGLNDSVRALAVSGGDLYAAGYFTIAGGVAANHIAKWDGNTWNALGSGVGDPSYVTALAVSGSNVYVGGSFTIAGGIAAINIAKWDGSIWSALGLGMNDSVSALAVSGSDLYAGGYFTTAGGIPVNAIAKWDGNAWTALGTGVGGTYPFVYALAVSANNLYVGGDFTTAGGKVSAYVAKLVLGPPPFYFVSTNGSSGFTNSQFYFTLIGPASSNAVIFASTNLQTWTPLVTNPLIGGSLNFTDTQATNFARRFYRGLLQP